MNVNELMIFLKDPNNIRGLFPNPIIISNILGIGGQGIVYEGEYSGVPAAIKVYFPGQIQQRIEREIESLRSLNCPNIVKLFWDGYLNVDIYRLNIVVTELISGQCLDRIINNSLSSDQIETLLFDISIAIRALWEKRIVHRDIKPSNIIFRPNGRACLIDLGIAKHVERSTLTAFGYTWGTLGYMSPEQIKGAKQLTFKSDIFSLGVIAMESFLGHHPTNGDQLRLLASQFHLQLPDPVERWQYSQILKKMLNPSPIYRPNTVEIINSLQQHRN